MSGAGQVFYNIDDSLSGGEAVIMGSGLPCGLPVRDLGLTVLVLVLDYCQERSRSPTSICPRLYEYTVLKDSVLSMKMRPGTRLLRGVCVAPKLVPSSMHPE